MIHTRKTIFKTLQKRIRELTKHANLSPKEFKQIMIAVILNDMKEWSEYIPKDDPNKIVKQLEDYLRNNCFLIERIPENTYAYVNVNTPQTNDTWDRVWDRECSVLADPELVSADYTWEPDPTCEIKFVYFYTEENQTPYTYLRTTYGNHGEKLKTVCDKMNIFIDRKTGEAWYLDIDGTWKPVANSEGSSVDPSTIISIVKENLTISHNQTDECQISSTIEDEQTPIVFCTNQELEDLI